MSSTAWRLARQLLPLAGLALLSACGGGTHWDGRRGYNGTGDYGYDLNASRAAASNYRYHAARSYPVPGTPDDPWGPYIREAASRYSIPDRWIRAVMHQESGGRLVGADGSLTTSSVGAMGLMQVMPATYDMLRQRYGLGGDPYAPHDNIMAGAAYIREMYDRFGSPGFVAAYNAGPDRLDAYLAGSSILPDETVNYLAQVVPNLGTDVAMTGPLAVYGNSGYGGSGVAVASLAATGGGAYDPNAAYAGGGMVSGPYAPAASGVADQDSDPSDRAFDGGGLVTAATPTGNMTGQGPAPMAVAQAAAQPAYVPPAYAQPSYAQSAYAQSAYAATPVATPAVAASAPASVAYQAATYDVPRSTGSVLGSRYASASAPTPVPYAPPVVAAAVASAPPFGSAEGGISGGGTWAIQVGAFPDPATSRAAVAMARSRAAGLLAGAQSAIIPVQRNGTLFRARLVGLSADTAALACTALTRTGTACFAVPPGG